MLMEYDSAEQTTKRINEDSTIQDMYDWDDFFGVYKCYSINRLNDFKYTKEFVCKIASTLTLMLTDTLNICPCGKAFSYVFWNEISLCQPINEGCKRPNKCSTSQFIQLNRLKKHCKKMKIKNMTLKQNSKYISRST